MNSTRSNDLIWTEIERQRKQRRRQRGRRPLDLLVTSTFSSFFVIKQNSGLRKAIELDSLTTPSTTPTTTISRVLFPRFFRDRPVVPQKLLLLLALLIHYFYQTTILKCWNLHDISLWGNIKNRQYQEFPDSARFARSVWSRSGVPEWVQAPTFLRGQPGVGPGSARLTRPIRDQLDSGLARDG